MRWNTIASAAPGRPPRPCEDAVAMGPDWVVVADGLGSTGHGVEASRRAVAVLGALAASPEARDARPAAFGVRVREAFAEAVDHDRTRATTCLFALVTDARLLVGQVGDGLAVVLFEDGHLERLLGGRGDFANETEALPRTAPTVRAFHPPAVRAVLLATDGVSDDVVDGQLEDFVRGWAELTREEPAKAAATLEAFLRDWRTPNSNDDRSLALLVRALPEETP